MLPFVFDKVVGCIDHHDSTFWGRRASISLIFQGKILIEKKYLKQAPHSKRQTKFNKHI